MKNLFWILLCYTFFTASNCCAENIILEKVVINLSSTKSNGKGWDTLRNAPDVALCIVTETNDHCYVQVKSNSSRKIENPLFKGKKQSLCPNAYSCTFEINNPLAEVLGFIVLDLDTKNNDFVDAVIIVNGSKKLNKNSNKVKKMDERIKNISYKYSQVFTEAEKRKRMKKTPVCEVQKSRETKCELQQSKVVIY